MKKYTFIDFSCQLIFLSSLVPYIPIVKLGDLELEIKCTKPVNSEFYIYRRAKCMVRVIYGIQFFKTSVTHAENRKKGYLHLDLHAKSLI